MKPIHRSFDGDGWEDDAEQFRAYLTATAPEACVSEPPSFYPDGGGVMFVITAPEPLYDRIYRWQPDEGQPPQE